MTPAEARARAAAEAWAHSAENTDLAYYCREGHTKRCDGLVAAHLAGAAAERAAVLDVVGEHWMVDDLNQTVCTYPHEGRSCAEVLLHELRQP